MQSGKGLRQALVVSSKQPKAVQPADAALHYPATWQEPETFLRLRQPDRLKLDSLIKCRLRRFLAGISLFGERHLNRLTRGQSDLTRQFPDLRALPFIGRPHVQSKQLSLALNCQVNVAALCAPYNRRNLCEAYSRRSTAVAPVENDGRWLVMAVLRARIIECISPASLLTGKTIARDSGPPQQSNILLASAARGDQLRATLNLLS